MIYTVYGMIQVQLWHYIILCMHYFCCVLIIISDSIVCYSIYILYDDKYSIIVLQVVQSTFNTSYSGISVLA